MRESASGCKRTTFGDGCQTDYRGYKNDTQRKMRGLKMDKAALLENMTYDALMKKMLCFLSANVSLT
jgi:hypothetical protein